MANIGSVGLPFTSNISSRDSYDYNGLPPELAAEEQALNRKQQMANYLIQQGLQPHQGQMTGRFYVPPSPLQGLAGLAQMALGAYSTSKNDDARKDISGRSNKMLADAMQQYKEASGPRITEGPRPTAPMASPPPSTDPHAGLMPQPAQPPQQMELPGPDAPVSTPRSPEETRQAMVDLMLNQHPQAQRIGGVLAGQYERAQEHGLQREFLGQQNNLLRQNRIDTQQAGFGRDLIMASQLGLNKKDLEEIKATNAKALEGIRGSNSATVANINADSRENVADMKVGQKGQLPAPALKMQQEGLDAIGLASSLNADIKALDAQVSSGKLKLGMVDNLLGQAKNFTGMSDEQSRNLATFKATLEKQRNDSLRLNKGVQTEGDAQRAWNELISNINDPKLVSQRLKEIAAINERAANIRKLEVDVIRKNYGVEPMETSGFTDQPAAVGAGQGVAPFTDAEKERRYQEFKKSHK